MSSGVEVNQQCIEVYQELKLKKNKKFIIFCLSKDFKNIEVQETSDDPDYEVFLAKLPVDECRWAVYDLEYETAEGKRQKLVFISWSPDDAKIKYKMVYASSKSVLRKTLVGITAEVQATERDEVSIESVTAKVNQNTR